MAVDRSYIFNMVVTFLKLKPPTVWSMRETNKTDENQFFWSKPVSALLAPSGSMALALKWTGVKTRFVTSPRYIYYLRKPDVIKWSLGHSSKKGLVRKLWYIAIITDLHQLCPRISNAIQCVICKKKWTQGQSKPMLYVITRELRASMCDRHKGSPSSQSLFSTTTDHRRHCHPSKWKYPLLCQNMKDLISALLSIYRYRWSSSS